MLNPTEETSLPTIVQIAFDWETRRSIALVPSSKDPKRRGMVLDIHFVDALWAGPIELPSLLREVPKSDSSQQYAYGETG